METYQLEINRSVQASRETVFKAFTEKEQLEKWLCPEGMTAKIDELELTPGGVFQVTMTSDENGSQHTARGTYKEVSGPEKLTFTWEWIKSEMGTGMKSLITVVLTENNDGTDVSFIHSEFETEKAREMHNQGWTSSFTRFDTLFA